MDKILNRCPAIRVAMFPKDTNGTGVNIFGGVILSHMDIAGAIAAREVTNHRVVTVAFDKVEFKKPVLIGDLLTCWSEVTEVGLTSITTRIVVQAQRKGVFIPVTEGVAVYVAVNEQGRPIPIKDDDNPAPTPESVGSSCGPCAHKSKDKPKQDKNKSKKKKDKQKKSSK